MKQIFVMFALLLGVCAANAQTTDTVKYAAGNDLYRGLPGNSRTAKWLRPTAWK